MHAKEAAIETPPPHAANANFNRTYLQSPNPLSWIFRSAIDQTGKKEDLLHFTQLQRLPSLCQPETP